MQEKENIDPLVGSVAQQASRGASSGVSQRPAGPIKGRAPLSDITQLITSKVRAIAVVWV
jgi:hypothetical protein